MENRGATHLPVWASRESIIGFVREHDTVIIVGETGSGKTTQVPQFLLDSGVAGRRMVGVTQPRRVAATSLARRVAAERGATDPAAITRRANEARDEHVGYAVRFDERANRNTRIKFVTDGMLIREMLGTSNGTPEVGLLRRYNVLVIDEAHERSLRTDMLLGLAKHIQRERRSRVEAGDSAIHPLKIIVMSATIDAAAFARFFGGDKPVPVLYVAGRQHSVRLFHTAEPCPDWMDAAVRTVMQIHVSRPPGDVLLFATGQEDIESLTQALQLYAAQLAPWAAATGRQVEAMQVCPLYAALGPAAAAAVFAPTAAHARKIVIATNIAETSVTIPGVRYVVDAGLAKEKVYAAHTGIEVLQVLPISQSSSVQRAGRAGREAPGECYRLYPKTAFDSLRPAPVPEIHRTDLGGAVLQLYAMGLDPFAFDWPEAPERALLSEAVLHLAELGAVVSAGGGALKLTPLGERMAALPVPPAFARMLLAAAEAGPRVARQARDLTAILSAERGLFAEPRDSEAREATARARDMFFDPSGDHATCLNALYAYLATKAHLARTHTSSTAHELRMWCQLHGVHARTVRTVLQIRQQLARICAQHGINCDDEAREDVEEDAEESGGDALWVTRGGRAPSRTEGESYTELVECLARGRLGNTALRQPDGTYRRIAGGQTFRIHPSSTLHPAQSSARGVSATSMHAIVFEELVLTTQTFARTVSRIDPGALQSLTTLST